MKTLAMTLFLVGLAGASVGCDFDRIDEARKCDQQLNPWEIEPEDTGTGTCEGDCESTPVCEDTATSTDTDFSCFNDKCNSDADCDCMPRTMCPLTGPDFIRNHCMIVDCSADDPTTCPEGTNCISAGSISGGLVDWLCWAV